MAVTAKQFVLDTLTHSKIRPINFQYGPLRVYPSGYQHDVASLVRDGHIQLTVSGGDAHYTINAAPGETHFMALPQRFVQGDLGGTLRVRSLSGREGAEFRGTIVHEATHALHDYQHARMETETQRRLRERRGRPAPPRARMAEGAAYLASWIARLQWGYPRLDPNGATRTSHAFARILAARVLDGDIVYVIPNSDVMTLNSKVAHASEDQYVFNGI